MTRKLIQTKKTTLAYGINDSATTIRLTRLLKLDGTSVSASDIGDLLYGTFDPGTSREEIFSIIGSNVTVNSDGTVDITSVVRGLKEISPYGTGGFKTDHPAGAVVVFGVNPQTLEQYGKLADDNTWAGENDFTLAPSAQEDAVNADELVRKSQLDSAVLGTLTLSPVVSEAIAGETLTVDTLVYQKDADGEWYKCDANTASTVDNVRLGITRGAGTDGNAITNGITLLGTHVASSAIFTANTPYFASDTAGEFSTSAGTVEVSVGYAISTTKIIFYPRYNQQITEDQQDALGGTSGTPSNTNKYVTNDDTSATSSANKLVRANASGKISDGFLNASLVENFTYGESISAYDAVYLKASDGKVYKCDAENFDENLFSFVGFALENGVANDSKQVQIAGEVDGFTGLTAGTEYLIASAGTSPTDTNWTGTGSDATVGDTASYARAVKFTTTKPGYLTSVVLSLKKAGTPTGTLSILIASGLVNVTGNTIACFSGIIGTVQTQSESALTTSYADYTYTFNQYLPAGTYYIGMFSNTSSAVNQTRVDSSGNDVDAYVDNSGTWANNTNKLNIDINFVNETLTAGDISNYFATYRKVIGIATSSTKLLIRPRKTTNTRIAKTENTGYVAECDGLLVMTVVASKTGTIYIDGIAVATGTAPASTQIIVSATVKKGSGYSFYNASTGNSGAFIPEI